LIANNSLEEQRISNISFRQIAAGFEYANVVIIGNEILQLRFAPTAGNIFVGQGAPRVSTRWLRHVVISSNVIGNGNQTPVPGGMIQLYDGTDIVLTANVLSADGNSQTTGIKLGQWVTNVKVSTSNIAGSMPAGLGVTPQ
jgi:hypothetical protein